VLLGRASPSQRAAGRGRRHLAATALAALAIVAVAPLATPPDGGRVPRPGREPTPPTLSPHGETTPRREPPRRTARARALSVELRPIDARVELNGLGDDGPTLVRYRFAGRVDRILDGRAFFLWDRGGRRGRAVAATRAQGRSDEVVVRFPSGTAAAQYALAAVDARAVADAAGKVNPAAATPLAQARGEGSTTAPELVAVVADEDLNRLRYRFDEPLQDGAVDADDFVFSTPMGALHRGDRVVALEGAEVVVEFSGPHDDVSWAVRPAVLPDAVRDRQGWGNTLGASPHRTAAPDLVHARLVGDTVAVLRFDEAVTDVVPSRVVVRSDGARRYEGRRWALADDATTVAVVFPGLDELSTGLAVVELLPGAVRDNDVLHPVPSTAAVAVLDQPRDDSATAGPDVVEAQLDRELGFLSLRFDEVLDEHAMAGRIRVIGGSGIPGVALEVLDVTADRVLVAFAEDDLAVARVVSLEPGAVRDRDGVPSPPALVRHLTDAPLVGGPASS
jgi:hypothetical protein